MTHFRRALQAQFEPCSARRLSRDSYAHPERISGSFVNEQRPRGCPVSSAFDRARLDFMPFWLRQYQDQKEVVFGIGRKWHALGYTFEAAARSLKHRYPGTPVQSAGRVTESNTYDGALYYAWKVRQKLSPQAIREAADKVDVPELVERFVFWNEQQEIFHQLHRVPPSTPLLLDNLHRLERYLELPLFLLTNRKQINPHLMTRWGEIALREAREFASRKPRVTAAMVGEMLAEAGQRLEQNPH